MRTRPSGATAVGTALTVSLSEPRSPESERELILRTLAECHWNRSLVAKKLGIGRRPLYDKITRLGIPLDPSA